MNKFISIFIQILGEFSWSSCISTKTTISDTNPKTKPKTTSFEVKSLTCRISRHNRDRKKNESKNRELFRAKKDPFFCFQESYN